MLEFQSFLDRQIEFLAILSLTFDTLHAIEPSPAPALMSTILHRCAVAMTVPVVMYGSLLVNKVTKILGSIAVNEP